MPGYNPSPDRHAEKVLRWATIEFGTAGLVDRIKGIVAVPDPPRQWVPHDTAVAGPVTLLARTPAPPNLDQRSSFEVVAETTTPGSVVLVACEAAFGAAFGSNIALQAAMSGAQAIVTDGVSRDRGRLPTVGIVSGSNGNSPHPTHRRRCVPTRECTMFGVTWQPGDWFLRDVDGVIHIHAADIEEIVHEIADRERGEIKLLLAHG